MMFIQGLKDRYDNLPSGKKQLVVAVSILTVIFLVFWLSVGSDEDAPQEQARIKTESLTITSDLMEDTLRESVRGETAALNNRILELETLVTDLIDRLEEDSNRPAPILPNFSAPQTRQITEDDLKPANELSDLALPEQPRFPPPFAESEETGAAVHDPDMQAAVLEVIGGIGGVKPVLTAIDEQPGNRRVYLPVGLMEAALLTGLDALVGNQAQSNPEPVLFRVQAPAVLPNDVRANLQGCFVIGNGIGILAKERVDVRAVSLSCIDDDKNTVIDQPIKGYFVDTDGKKGLSGKVVTREGALVGRAFAAGLLEGFGSVTQAGAGTQTISPLGSTRIFDTEQALVSGLGQGIGDTASTISEYWLDIAKTISPVIEVGTLKPAVLVIQEGVFLEIKEMNNVAGS